MQAQPKTITFNLMTKLNLQALPHTYTKEYSSKNDLFNYSLYTFYNYLLLFISIIIGNEKLC